MVCRTPLGCVGRFRLRARLGGGPSLRLRPPPQRTGQADFPYHGSPRRRLPSGLWVRSAADRGSPASPRAPTARLTGRGGWRGVGRRQLAELTGAWAGRRCGRLRLVVETGLCRPSACTRSRLADARATRRRPCRPAAGGFSDTEKPRSNRLGAVAREEKAPMTLICRVLSVGLFLRPVPSQHIGDLGMLPFHGRP